MHSIQSSCGGFCPHLSSSSNNVAIPKDNKMTPLTIIPATYPNLMVIPIKISSIPILAIFIVRFFGVDIIFSPISNFVVFGVQKVTFFLVLSKYTGV